MQRRLLWSVRVFQISVAGVLASGALSAVAWQYGQATLMHGCNALIVASGLAACIARGWQWAVQRSIRREDFQAGAGHYGLEQFRDGRFLSP